MLPPPITSSRPARIISIVNQKGGVGKTTSAINLGASLAELGKKILLVDFDPQGALSVGLGINPNKLKSTVYDVLKSKVVKIHKSILSTGVFNIDLLPANINLSAAEMQLVNERAREKALSRILRHIVFDYDIIIVDCQPSLGILTINALTASHGAIIPLICEFFALRAVALLIETIKKVKNRLNPYLKIDGLLATMYDPRTLHSREVIERLIEVFKDTVFKTVISKTVQFPDSNIAAKPITLYATDHSGAKAYRQLAKELIEKWNKI